jgi:hypothetical protein
LGYLELLSILPFCVPCLVINEHCFVVVLRHLKSVLVDRSVAEILQLGLVDNAR